MKLALKLTTSLIYFTEAQNTYKADCFRISSPFGDLVSSTDVVKSDITKIKSLDNISTYSVDLIVTCVLNGKVIGQRLGISNNNVKPPETHSASDTVYLTTFGGGSFNKACESYWLPKDTYITSVTLNYLKNSGIIGTIIQVSNGDYKVYGDVTGESVKSFKFSKERMFIGYEGV